MVHVNMPVFMLVFSYLFQN